MPTGGLRETLGKIRHRKPQPVFCPRCGSSDMKQTPSFGLLPVKWRCNACGYEGTLVVELQPDENVEGREAL
jgi:ribosomal protein L37AE/L43A